MKKNHTKVTRASFHKLFLIIKDHLLINTGYYYYGHILKYYPLLKQRIEGRGSKPLQRQKYIFQGGKHVFKHNTLNTSLFGGESQRHLISVFEHHDIKTVCIACLSRGRSKPVYLYKLDNEIAKKLFLFYLNNLLLVIMKINKVIIA